ncbi:MAG: hypothetical protein OSA51_00700 [Octadecabacter sp.]|nr:hypothetical protein [Octadecabacter sp.]
MSRTVDSAKLFHIKDLIRYEKRNGIGGGRAEGFTTILDKTRFLSMTSILIEKRHRHILKDRTF